MKQIFAEPYEFDFMRTDSSETPLTLSGNQGFCDFYSGGIEFPKNLFHNIPDMIARRWSRRISMVLYRYRKVLLNNRFGGNNDIKHLKGSEHGVYRISKCRIDGNYRMLWYFESSTFHILSISEHDKQDQVTIPTGQKMAGHVFWPIDAFLRRIYSYNEILKMHTRRDLERYLITEDRFVYDQQQEEVIEKAEDSSAIRNLSIIGNAGSGKSVVGYSWLQRCLEQDVPGIYLTMSKNLTERMREIFTDENGIRTNEAEAFSLPFTGKSLTFQDTFSFLTDSLSRTGWSTKQTILNPQESFSFFQTICHQLRQKDRRILAGDEVEYGAQVSLAWRQIHGIIKGFISNDRKIDFQAEPLRIGEPLTAQEYWNRKMRGSERQEAEAAVSLQRLYRAYQRGLEDENYLDDNDIARLILQNVQVSAKHNRAIAPVPQAQAWEYAFIDECQDLTEVQFLAISYLLKNCRRKLFASDRCQMIQPTSFDAGRMLSRANSLYGLEGESVPPFYLHQNYRASFDIVAFQNYIVQHSHIARKKSEEEPIRAMMPHEDSDHKPIYIAPTSHNKELLEKLLDELNDAEIKLLVADRQFASFDTMHHHLYVDDMFACKGLEYPSILLWNVLEDMARGAGMGAGDWPWRYFYVGATRAQRRLLIFDEAQSAEAHDFWEKAIASGTVESCPNLSASKNSGMSWYRWILGWLKNLSTDEKIQLAENYEEMERYKEAAAIYKQFAKIGYREEYLRCQAMVYYENHDYDGMLRAILSLKHQDVLIKRFLAAPLSRETFAAYVVSRIDEHDDDALQMARLEVMERFGKVDDFLQIIEGMHHVHPLIYAKACRWEAQQKEKIADYCEYLAEKVRSMGDKK